MNEELDSQLSAMFDDELPQEECELLARRLSRDDVLKARWRRYAVIGAAIRSERGVRLDANLAARVGAAISAEPILAGSVASSGAASQRLRRWWQPAAAVAVAAGVAAMSILWMRSQSPLGEQTIVAENPAPRTASEISAVEQSTQPPRYVVPTPTESRAAVPVAELANYVVAHSEFSTPLSRRNLLSALVASESGTSGTQGESEEAVEDPYTDVQDAK